MAKKIDGLLEAQKIAESKNGKCLSKEYINKHSIMKFECSVGHQWKTSFRIVVYNGSWCPKCGIMEGHGKQKINGLFKAKRIASNRDGFCISNTYENNYTKIRWRCKNEHEWNACLANVKDKNQWCPKCEDISRRLDGLKEASDMALLYNGKCLSNNYENNTTPLKWQCEKDHIWEAPLNHIKYSKTWCPKCLNKTQNLLIKILEDIFPKHTIYSNYKKFEWLKTKSGYRQELDMYIPELKLAIEYDGRQHFEPVQFGGISLKEAKENLKTIKKLDKLKNKKIKEHPEDIKYFIRFDYKEKISKEYVLDRIKSQLEVK